MSMSKSLAKPPVLSPKRKFLTRLIVSFLVFSMLSSLGIFNSRKIPIVRAAASSHLLISEVFYDTPGTDPDEEWIEIYNPTGYSVNISHYKVGDEEAQGGSEGMFEFPVDTILESGSKITVALKATGFSSLYGKDPDFEVIETSASVPNMIKYSSWGAGSTIALANTGDEVLLLNASDSLVDAVAYKSGSYAGVIPHPGVSTGHSIERFPADQDSDDCSVDFQDQAVPNPGASAAPPENKSPLANPGGLYNGSEGSSIQFDGSLSSDPDGDPLTYLWDFGDGTTSNEKNPIHTYHIEGTYQVNLIVNDGEVNSIPSQTTAEIADTNPLANFLAQSTSGNAPLTINFTDTSSSYDGIISRQWDFDNDGTKDSTEQNPTHVYTTSGTFTVSLTIQEADGDEHTEIKTAFVTVSPEPNQAPVANPNGPHSGAEGSSILFDGSLSSDPDDDPLTYLWDFGDGATSDDKNPAHTYLQEGNYTVTLVVNDGKTNSDPSISTATVYDTDPVADFTTSTTTGIVSLGVNFTDISTSYDGISSWQWDFDNDGMVDSTDQNPAHVYPNPGSYTVSLTVQEADGDRDIETKTDYITVSPSPNRAPVANAAGPYFGTEGIPVSFDGTSSLDPDGGSLIYNWDFGDGVTSTEMNPTHTYTQEGNYTVSLVVNDGKTESDPANTTAFITDIDPVAGFTTSATSGEAPLTVSFTDLSTSLDGIIAWEWDFDNDGVIDSNNQNPSHKYQNPGVYTVSLTVSEADGDNHSEVKSGLVTVVAPASTPYQENWDYIFEDSQSGTELRINTQEKLFQFVTTHKEFPVKKADKMKVHQLTDLTIIRIKHKDCELWIRAVVVLDSEIDFAAAVIQDKKAKKTYLLLDLMGPKN